MVFNNNRIYLLNQISTGLNYCENGCPSGKYGCGLTCQLGLTLSRYSKTYAKRNMKDPKANVILSAAMDIEDNSTRPPISKERNVSLLKKIGEYLALNELEAARIEGAGRISAKPSFKLSSRLSNRLNRQRRRR